MLAITEHAPAMPGTCHSFYFENLKVVSRKMCGIEMLFGAELNVIDYDGTVDLELPTLKKMDITIASFHVPCIAPGTREQNTKAMLKAMKNPYVNIIGHPDDGRFPVDFEAVVKGAKEYKVLLEVNNTSLGPNGPRKNARENDTVMLEWCKKYEVPVVMGSDAHICDAVGNHEYAIRLMQELNFPEKLVVNRDKDELKKYINRYKF